MVLNYLSSQKWDADIDSAVLKSGDGQTLGLEIQGLARDVEEDILAPLGLCDADLQVGQRLGAVEVEDVTIFAADDQLHLDAVWNDSFRSCFS